MCGRGSGGTSSAAGARAQDVRFYRAQLFPVCGETNIAFAIMMEEEEELRGGKTARSETGLSLMGCSRSLSPWGGGL